MDEEKDQKLESSVSSISSNDLLTTIYDITRAIFRHLPIRSVDSCALVCQSWADLARLTKSQRHTIHTLTYPVNPLSPTAECSTLLSDFDAYFTSYINNQLWSIPYFAFVVVTNSLEEKGFRSSSSSPPPTKNARRLRSEATARRTERLSVAQTVTRHLNRSCQVFTVVSNGIIASDEENQSNEIESDDAMGILLFPKFPSNILGIYPFEIPRNADIPKEMSRSDLHRLLGGVPNDIPIRCVVFFMTRRQLNTVECITKLLEHYSSEIAIIGGFAHQIHYDDRKNSQSKPSNTHGIVFTGDPNHFTIRQVVLKPHLTQRESIKHKLQQLKSNENQSNFSFGIQISCVARGADFYNNQVNVECSEFRNLFPNTPLIGLFGNGEIGHDYSSSQEKPAETAEGLFLTYSSVFSLISINL